MVGIYGWQKHNETLFSQYKYQIGMHTQKGDSPEKLEIASPELDSQICFTFNYVNRKW